MDNLNVNEVIRPKQLITEPGSTATYGKFTLKPLEKGFGLTLGNSLRRVMLSSIQGAAVTAVRIDGVVHEFAAIPDVKEDVAAIILNLKSVRFKLHGDRTSVLLEKQGPCIVRASDIIVNESVEVLNPEQEIATIGVGGKLRIEMIVARGRGYVPAENNRHGEDLPLGWIVLDSSYSPVRRVNYVVNPSRVGERVDFDALTFEVWTDGSVLPNDAVAFTSKIIRDQLSVFMNVEQDPQAVMEKPEGGSQFNPNLYRTVEELELSVRSANCLQNANIRYIYELVMRSEGDMLKTKNFGRKSLNEIKELLTEMGLSLGMKLEGFVPPGASAPAVDSSVNDDSGDADGDANDGNNQEN